MDTWPKNCGLLDGNGNKLKFKTTAKLKDKRTSIATVWGLYRMYATFPTPLGSHYRLPLNSALSTISKRKHKRFDIEAYYWNKTKTFWFGPLFIRTKSERFNMFQNCFKMEMERLGDFLKFKNKTRTKPS